MPPGQKRACAVLLFLLSRAALSAQEGGFSLPLDLLRPRHGEAPHFPKDYAIGELGRGEAGEEAYQAARRIMGRLAGGDEADAPAHVKPVLSALKELELRGFRIGGGQNEADGSVSFLVRFLGREEAVTGELYLRRPETETGNETPGGAEDAGSGAPWRFDDLILDKKRPLTEGRYGPESGNMSPYERFF